MKRFYGQDASRCAVRTPVWQTARKFLALVAGVGLGAAATSNNAEASLFPDGTTHEKIMNFRNAFKGDVLSLKILVPVGIGARNTSATFFNSEYALTSAHNLYDLI